MIGYNNIYDLIGEGKDFIPPFHLVSLADSAVMYDSRNKILFGLNAKAKGKIFAAIMAKHIVDLLNKEHEM